MASMLLVRSMLKGILHNNPRCAMYRLYSDISAWSLLITRRTGVSVSYSTYVPLARDHMDIKTIARTSRLPTHPYSAPTFALSVPSSKIKVSDGARRSPQMCALTKIFHLWCSSQHAIMRKALSADKVSICVQNVTWAADSLERGIRVPQR